jgi:hypothetical protein
MEKHVAKLTRPAFQGSKQRLALGSIPEPQLNACKLKPSQALVGLSSREEDPPGVPRPFAKASKGTPPGQGACETARR